MCLECVSALFLSVFACVVGCGFRGGGGGLGGSVKVALENMIIDFVRFHTGF